VKENATDAVDDEGEEAKAEQTEEQLDQRLEEAEASAQAYIPNTGE